MHFRRSELRELSILECYTRCLYVRQTDILLGSLFWVGYAVSKLSSVGLIVVVIACVVLEVVAVACGIGDAWPFCFNMDIAAGWTRIGVRGFGLYILKACCMVFGAFCIW